MESKRCIAQNDMSLCTGCMACMDVCPVKAITENFSRDGFRIPRVDEKKCVHCGKCLQVCNINVFREHFMPIKISRMRAKDDVTRMKCSSGGIFALLAEKTVENGGTVVGAVFDARMQDVCHSTSDECELDKIYRSKYVQSNTCGIYNKTVSILQEGRDVLFCGTPCQVRALYSFVKDKNLPGKLLTVDFMCHGVPSTMNFKDFLGERERQENSPVVNVTFREKDAGWRRQVIKVYYANGNVWKKTSYYYYYFMFLNNYSLRDSCYFCKEYAAHIADITLADDWNGKDNDDIGTSLVFVNSCKGEKAIYDIADQTKDTDVTKDIMENLSVYSHDRFDYRKKKLWKDTLETGGYKKAKTFLYFKALVPSLIIKKIRDGKIEIKKLGSCFRKEC